MKTMYETTNALTSKRLNTTTNRNFQIKTPKAQVKNI